MKAYVQKQPDEVANCQHEWFLITLYNRVPAKESIVALESNQEKAYAKVFLCAQFAETLGTSSITVVTVDSDIGILSLFCNLYLKTQIVFLLGSSSTIGYLDISTTTLSEDLHEALPGSHTFTEWESTSAFAGKRKLKCFKIRV